MKTLTLKITLASVFSGLMALTSVSTLYAAPINFGDFRSETLIGKAWRALENDDIEAVIAYTNKCVELYDAAAKEMQANQTDYMSGTDQNIFSLWALNDVATGLFIQAEAFRKAGMDDEAKETYNRIINDYSFGQTYDVGGKFFWKPAEASKEKMVIMDSGSRITFGDYSSSFLTTQAWKALNDDKLDDVLVYTEKVLQLYEKKALEMQSGLETYPEGEDEDIFKFWALNDVGTSLFIQGEAHKRNGADSEAKIAYEKLINNFAFAQCWNTQGFFWKPAEAAQEALETVEVGLLE